MTAEAQEAMDLQALDRRVLLATLREAALHASSPDEARKVTAQIRALTTRYQSRKGSGRRLTVIDHARQVEGERYTVRPHLQYLSDRLTKAMHDVENGQNRLLTVSMPPRMGKSVTTSQHFPTMILREHPDWKIGMISHDASLVGGWARSIRSTIEEMPALGITLKRDYGGGSGWDTVEGGGVTARSIGGSVTGKGFKVLILDDLVKDIAAAHSETLRNSLWEKWAADFFTRLEGPYLVVAVGTRWHEDDFIGRLLSANFEGDPRDWEQITFPALAEEDDVLGRLPGEPLYSPIVDETEEEALTRWETVKRTVGSYTWAALYQQRPAPAKGAIFNTDWWRYWTRNPGNVSRTHEERCPGGSCSCPEDGRVILWRPEEATGARWTDSWDMAFKGGSESDFVVGQRWAKEGPTRYLVAQSRARMTFTQTLARLRDWCDPEKGDPPGTVYVHERLVEDKANGTAALSVLRDKISGLVPVNPTDSKEGRARSVTPEVEAGNVRLPYPGEEGHEWVSDLIAEARNFPVGSNDDQVDALTQYLNRVRDSGAASITVPGRSGGPGVNRNLGAAARSGIRRAPGR